MNKASIAATGRASRADHASRRVSRNALRKESLRFGYLKLVILLLMVFLPWVAIIYVARLVLTGH
jgi:hypothetical protein